MKLLLRSIAACAALFSFACDSRVIDVEPKKEAVMNIYKNTLHDVHGTLVDDAEFIGKVTLVVNLASKCGLTPQYEDLQALHEKYGAQGFSVVGFPCNDFGGQEPGNAETIIACASGYGADFPIMEKVSVLESDAQCEVYKNLFEATGALPKWNFGKYLIDKNGTPIAFFGSRVEPLALEITTRIEESLKTQ
jgi:glutathione peroxidase